MILFLIGLALLWFGGFTTGYVIGRRREREQAATQCVHDIPLTKPCVECRGKADDAGFSPSIRIVDPQGDA